MNFIKFADAKRITSLNSLDNAVIDEYVSCLHTTLSDKQINHYPTTIKKYVWMS